MRRPPRLLIVLLALLLAAWLIEGYARWRESQGKAADPYAALDQRARKLTRERQARGLPTLLSKNFLYHEQLGWVMEPNLRSAHGLHSKPTTTNSIGLRGGIEYAPVKPANTLRIVCIGDSFTFGSDVEDVETWVATVDVELNRSGQRVEVLNFGVPGYGADQAALMLELRALEWDPDLVIWGLFQGDLARNLRAFSFAAKPKFELLEGALHLTEVPVPNESELGSPTAPTGSWSRAWDWLASRSRADAHDLGRAIAARVQRLCREQGAELLIVAIGSKNAPIDGELFREILSWEADLGVSLINVETLWQDDFPYQRNGHFTPAANLTVGKEVAAWVRARGLVATTEQAQDLDIDPDE